NRSRDSTASRGGPRWTGRRSDSGTVAAPGVGGRGALSRVQSAPRTRSASRCGFAVAIPVDAELAHPGSKRVGVDPEKLGGTLRALDPALAARERPFDVVGHRLVERGKGAAFRVTVAVS